MIKKEMKEYILRLRAGDKEIFSAIKNGTKKIETRVATLRYRKIGKGDILVFVCEKEKLKREVLSAKVFRGVVALFKQYRIKDVMPQASTLAEAEKKVLLIHRL